MAMWKEGNESSLMCVDVTWLWPCDKERGGSLTMNDIIHGGGHAE